MTANPDTQSNVDKWNELAKGTPFEGMGDILKDITLPVPKPLTRQDLIDRTSPTQSDKTLPLEQIVDTLQLRSFDIAINEPDNYMKELKEYRAEAIAAITAREERLVAEAFKQKLTEYKGQPQEFYRMMQQEYGNDN